MSIFSKVSIKTAGHGRKAIVLSTCLVGTLLNSACSNNPNAPDLLSFLSAPQNNATVGTNTSLNTSLGNNATLNTQTQDNTSAQNNVTQQAEIDRLEQIIRRLQAELELRKLTESQNETVGDENTRIEASTEASTALNTENKAFSTALLKQKLLELEATKLKLEESSTPDRLTPIQIDPERIADIRNIFGNDVSTENEANVETEGTVDTSTDNEMNTPSPDEGTTTHNGKIVFTSGRGELHNNYEIYVVNPDGSELQRLTQNDVDDHSPSFYPNGTEILYACGSQLCKVNLQGEVLELSQASDGYSYHNPQLSPDGTQILATRFDQASSSSELVLMSNELEVQASLGSGRQAVFSPNGNEIAFVRQEGSRSDLYHHHLDTQTTTQLTNDTSIEMMPRFTPTGDAVIYTASGTLRFYQVDIASQERSQFITGQEAKGAHLSLTWSPDGQSLAYGLVDSGNTRLNNLDFSTTNSQVLTDVNQGTLFVGDWH